MVQVTEWAPGSFVIWRKPVGNGGFRGLAAFLSDMGWEPADEETEQAVEQYSRSHSGQIVRFIFGFTHAEKQWAICDLGYGDPFLAPIKELHDIDTKFNEIGGLW